MSFSEEPYSHIDIHLSEDGRQVWWECDSCGGGWRDKHPRYGADGISPHLGPFVPVPGLLEELLRTWHKHLKESHKRYPRCGFFVIVGQVNRYCTLPENHTDITYQEVGDFERGPVPHHFDFTIPPEEERRMATGL